MLCWTRLIFKLPLTFRLLESAFIYKCGFCKYALNGTDFRHNSRTQSGLQQRRKGCSPSILYCYTLSMPGWFISGTQAKPFETIFSTENVHRLAQRQFTALFLSSIPVLPQGGKAQCLENHRHLHLDDLAVCWGLDTVVRAKGMPVLSSPSYQHWIQKGLWTRALELLTLYKPEAVLVNYFILHWHLYRFVNI